MAPGSLGCLGQCDDESAAMADSTLDADLPVVGLDDGFHDCEAKPRATCCPAARSFPAEELLENMWHILGANPFSCVRHLDHYTHTGGIRVHRHTAAARRMTNGITHKVGEYAADLASIDIDRVHTRSSQPAQHHILLLGHGTEPFDRIRHQVGYGIGCALKLETTCI